MERLEDLRGDIDSWTTSRSLLTEECEASTDTSGD
jgi:hypothetical protein